MRESVDQLERPRRCGYRLQRMDVGEPGQACQFLVEPRVVLHRAGAERIEPGVYRVVLLRKPREVPHDLRLAKPRQTDLPLPFEAAEAVVEQRGLGQIDAAMPRRILLE